ncbi:MAG: hypothetical protein GQ570_04050 [Helicobacteraceae bacterium]|nr:hypothetical protein [Helicobacteraceae bacterium]
MKRTDQKHYQYVVDTLTTKVEVVLDTNKVLDIVYLNEDVIALKAERPSGAITYWVMSRYIDELDTCNMHDQEH